ncbi:MFS sugar transporter [Rhodotorula toruloides]|uniref:MFS sugar transporter n=1 Tax=Rhodotorula toruloides TaxID=5286 RepID=A0A511KIV1_RHOTO|nr:MFS sugar transporter [Rhodotorula toruloides]
MEAIAYYSSVIFENAGTSEKVALLASFGHGAINWVFSPPAFFTIDAWGRRSLLLFTLPFLSLFMFIAGSGFYLQGDKNQLEMGPGAGPVPFSYSAEVFPLQVREIGMVSRNFVNALVFPLQIQSWGSGPAFYWSSLEHDPLVPRYAYPFPLLSRVPALTMVEGHLMFCPETKQFTLEELDEVFSMSTSRHVAYGLTSPAYWFRRYILRQKVQRVPLHEWNPSEEKDRPMIEHREKETRRRRS